MYEGQAGADYDTIIEAKAGYKKLLDKYKINFFIDYLNDPIVRVLVNDPGWKYVYSDQQYVVFVKNASQNAAFLSKYWSKSREQAFRSAYSIALGQLLANNLNQQGTAEADTDNLSAALIDFAKAQQYDPRSVSVRLNLAQVLAAMGDYPQAEQEYRYVLAHIDAGNPAAKKDLEIVKKLLR